MPDNLFVKKLFIAFKSVFDAEIFEKERIDQSAGFKFLVINLSLIISQLGIPHWVFLEIQRQNWSWIKPNTAKVSLVRFCFAYPTWLDALLLLCVSFSSIPLLLSGELTGLNWELWRGCVVGYSLPPHLIWHAVAVTSQLGIESF